MSIIEKIKALIKAQIRREELNFASLGGGGQTMNIGALEWVLKQLDTLQEQPVCDGFDREFSKFSNDVDAEHPFPICVDEYKDFARHFYELGRQSKPKVGEDLKTEAKKYSEHTRFHWPNQVKPSYDAFIAGATWRDRQLNWIRDLAKAGIEKPEEAVNILKRIDGLLNQE